jgi:uncharacterized membrane protein
MFITLINTAKAAVSLPDMNSTQDLGVFIQNIYSFAISIVGILIFVRFIWAGWLYLTAAANAGNIANSKKMMKDALIGAVLLFSSYLILYIINPDLVQNTFNFSSLIGN